MIAHVQAKLIMAGIGVVGIANGVVHYAVDRVFDDTTIRALIIAGTTGVIAGGFGLLIAKVQAQADARQHERLDYIERRLDDVAGSVGANKRSGDPDGSQETRAPATDA